jgi:PPK2 family polyphosphate:nucleotide phosphotransferase
MPGSTWCADAAPGDDLTMNLRELLRLPAGGPVDLSAIDPAGTPGLPARAGRPRRRWAAEQLVGIGAELASYQERLYASAKAAGDRRRVLLVLQAMDCGGKDGTTRKVAGTMNPQGLHIVGFGKPTEEERAHDFLWRIRRALPAPGYLGVFNRSHYEDVLVVRVHELVPPQVWRERYEQINAFEQELAEDGLTILKVMLHISYAEQRERLLERLADPTKHWKYNPGDIAERELWPAYQQAYADALARCSTERAPWYVVPADRKWYRDWAVAVLLRDTLADLGLRYPPGEFDPRAEKRRLIEADRLAELPVAAR